MRMAVQDCVWYTNPLLEVVPALESIHSIHFLLHGRSLCGLESHGWAVAGKNVLRAGKDAGASRPLSVLRALSDSDRDSGDETEGGERGREKRIRQRNQRQGLDAGLGRGLVTFQ